MQMTYSLQLRQKVFSTKEKFHLTFARTSQRFDVPIRTLFRWQRKIALCMTRDKPATRLDKAALAKDIEISPDAYQWEKAKRLALQKEPWVMVYND